MALREASVSGAFIGIAVLSAGAGAYTMLKRVEKEAGIDAAWFCGIWGGGRTVTKVWRAANNSLLRSHLIRIFIEIGL